MFNEINTFITQIKKDKPLVLNLTNDVTMDFIANGLLSLGASPIMSQAEEEMADLIKISQAIVVNLGTLNARFINLCEHACKIANQLRKPIILDPVGAGASQYRTHTSQQFIKNYHIDIIRGNASEIMALYDATTTSKGVDSSTGSHDAITSAQALANLTQATIVISGATDVIVANNTIQYCTRGSALMPMVTGTGCLFSAVVGAFRAVNDNSFAAAHAATVFYAVCGEIAAQRAQTPGMFKTQFIDALYALPSEQHYA